MARLSDLNRVRREHDELCRRLGLNVRPVVLEEASAVGRPAVSGSAPALGDPERAVASSSTDEDAS